MSYTLAHARRPAPTPPPACDSITCLVLSGVPESGTTPRGHRFAVLVAGHPLRFDAGAQARDALADLDARNWLEDANAELRRLNANPSAPECSEDLSYPAGAGSLAGNRCTTAA